MYQETQEDYLRQLLLDNQDDYEFQDDGYCSQINAQSP